MVTDWSLDWKEKTESELWKKHLIMVISW
jgi:hypothetical protein